MCTVCLPSDSSSLKPTSSKSKSDWSNMTFGNVVSRSSAPDVIELPSSIATGADNRQHTANWPQDGTLKTVVLQQNSKKWNYPFLSYFTRFSKQIFPDHLRCNKYLIQWFLSALLYTVSQKKVNTFAMPQLWHTTACTRANLHNFWQKY